MCVKVMWLLVWFVIRVIVIIGFQCFYSLFVYVTNEFVV